MDPIANGALCLTIQTRQCRFRERNGGEQTVILVVNVKIPLQQRGTNGSSKSLQGLLLIGTWRIK